MQHRSPGTWTKIFYGFGSVAFGVKDNGFAFFLLLYYNQVLGLPEAWVGFGIMIALIADAFFDPIVGYVSDHLDTRWGRRHPFMYASAPLVAISYYFLWNPPAGLTQEQLFVYFVGVAIVVRILIACYEIPSASLVPELTDHYDERTQILSYRFFFGWWGGLTMAVLAYAVFLQPDASQNVGVLSAEGYRHFGTAAAVVMFFAILISSVGTHPFIPHLRKPTRARHSSLGGALMEVRDALANRSFLSLFGAAIFGSMAAGLSAALAIYFNTYFWELSSHAMSILVLLNFVSAAIALAVAPRLSIRFGKKLAAMMNALGAVVLAPLPVVLRLIGLFPANDSTALLPTLAVLNTLVITLFIIASILIASMVADVVEDSEVTTGRRSEGIFFAVNAFVQKSVSGIGIFTSTLLLSAIGFPPDAKPGTVDPEVVRNLGLAFAPVVVLLFLIMIGCISLYRISRDTHEANLQRLGRVGSTSS
jgi:Na+/melibiose symporter-like transporter